jgi:puromycin-sensitive aminopeptidase
VDLYRLPQTVIPSRYDLRLEPDLAQATFAGSETIEVTVRESVNTVMLNAAELQITEAVITDEEGRPVQAIIELDAATDLCLLTFPETLKPGHWRLRLVFTGILNAKLRGFYRSTYKDAQGQEKVLAATQFEATDARRAFPCWDEPAFKAVFSTTLTIDPALKAVSNTAALSEHVVNRKKIIRFKDTIAMSTYLVAFVVGDLEASPPVAIGTTPLRIWTTPGKSHLTEFGLEIAAASLRFFEDYYGIPYPSDKLDLLAIPDFASGAMENLGAITFRETALLVDPHTSTHAERERIADVVAHENAHMWFGDLVTMSWWNGLWLNEAFATFMEMLAVDHWKPEWRRWDAFGASRAGAMSVDGLHNTRPIEFPVHAPKDAEAMFDTLTYEKGASVLRMLEQYLGPEVFRAGVRHYLTAHAYGNADTRDLWVSLEQAAKQPVPALMDAWVFTPGYPLITARVQSGNQLVLSQQRFTYLPSPPNDTPEESRTAATQLWHVPIQYQILTKSGSQKGQVLLTARETTVPLPNGAETVLLNAGGHGFYRVRYSDDLLNGLLQRLPHDLAPIERFNLVSDVWAATKSGLVPLDRYLDLTATFRQERDKNVWTVLLGSFSTLNHIIDPATRPLLEALVRDRVGPLAGELGWEPKPGESELITQLRGDLLRALGMLGNDQTVKAKAEELFADYGKPAGTKVDPNLWPAVVGTLAHHGDLHRYDEFTERYRKPETPQEERRFLFSLTSFQPIALLQRTLDHTLDGDIRTQDGPFIISSIMGSVYGRELGWTFVKQQWDELDKRFPKQGLRRMCGGITGLATPELEADVRRFFAERNIDLGGKTLAQYLEQLRIMVSFKQAAMESLTAYLTQLAKH